MTVSLLRIYCSQPHLQPDLAVYVNAFQPDFQVHVLIRLSRIISQKSCLANSNLKKIWLRGLDSTNAWTSSAVRLSLLYWNHVNKQSRYEISISNYE